MRISDWSSDVCSSDLLGVAPTSVGTRRIGTATARVLSSLLSGFGPAPEEVVIDASELEDSIVVGSVEREFLDGGVHFEQHLALAVVAHQALDPEEGGEPGAAGHRLDAVKAARGIEDGSARGQRASVLAKGVADDQPPSDRKGTRLNS